MNVKNICLFLLLSVANVAFANGKVTIELKFKNFSEFQDLSYYSVSCNILKPVAPFSFGSKHGLYDNNGDFTFTSHIDYPSLARINWYNQSIVLPVFPDDSLKIEIDLSIKNNDISSLIKHHSKSHIETDAFIYKLNKEVRSITNEQNSSEIVNKYIDKAQGREQEFFSIIYLGYLEQEKITIKHQKIRFLAFDEVLNRHPEALRYSEVLNSVIVDAKSDFIMTSEMLKKEIVIYKDTFSDFSLLLEKIRNEHQGKIVFIDFWGTWCGACLYDIAQKKKLGMDEIFKEYEIESVYLCRSSPRKEFDYYINKLEMQGEHYFVSKELAKNVKTNFRVTSYPHYMFLNKKGELINDIPRPIITKNSIASINLEFIERIKTLNE